MDAQMEHRIRHREEMFLKRLFSILSKMAKLDGRATAWEVHAAEGAFSRFPQALARRQFCVKVFNASMEKNESLTRLAKDFAMHWASPSECLAIYELLWDIACSRGVLKSRNKDQLRGICPCLGLPSSYFDIFYRKRKEFVEEEARNHKQKGKRESTRGKRTEHGGQNADSDHARRSNKTPVEKAYELLGCKKGDSYENVRQAYRLAAKMNHPDMLRSRGYHESAIRLATEKMSQLNEAWRLIRLEERF